MYKNRVETNRVWLFRRGEKKTPVKQGPRNAHKACDHPMQ